MDPWERVREEFVFKGIKWKIARSPFTRYSLNVLLCAILQSMMGQMPTSNSVQAVISSNGIDHLTKEFYSRKIKNS